MMRLLKDEKGQGAAEYILLLGGVIVIAIVALILYRSYFTGQNLSIKEDIANVRTNVSTNQPAP